MNELAESFHSDNLKIALEQLNNTGKVLPRLSALKDGEAYEFSIIGMKLEAALDILEFQMKPDVVNLIAMAWSHTHLPDNKTKMANPKQRLFAMTFDHFGGHQVSLLEIYMEGGTIKARDLDSSYCRASNPTFHTNDSGDLEVCLESDLPRT